MLNVLARHSRPRGRRRIAVIYDQAIENRRDFPAVHAMDGIDDVSQRRCAAILRDALATLGLLRMRARNCCSFFSSANSDLILRSTRALPACVSKDGHTHR